MILTFDHLSLTKFLMKLCKEHNPQSIQLSERDFDEVLDDLVAANNISKHDDNWFVIDSNQVIIRLNKDIEDTDLTMLIGQPS